MMNFRLTYNGPLGFDYRGFDSLDEMIEWAMHQANLGLIVPLKMLKYNPVIDEYKVIGNFTRS